MLGYGSWQGERPHTGAQKKDNALTTLHLVVNILWEELIMRHKIILSLLLIVFFIAIPPSVRALTLEEIKKLPHISATQAFYLFKQNKILLLDVHDNKEKAEIVGAYYLPSKKIEKVKLKIPKDKLIGVFCD